jgi:transcription antitermination factor NusG
MAHWYVVETKRHKELAAQARLAQRGLETYLPRLQLWPRPAVGSDVAPMFPGYLFVRPAELDFYAVGLTAGVRGFVTVGGLPAPLDPSVVDYLREREGADGIIRTANPMQVGREVVIKDGPLRGIVAVVERRLTARQRVLVLIEILQRQTRVELPEKWVREA